MNKFSHGFSHAIDKGYPLWYNGLGGVNMTKAIKLKSGNWRCKANYKNEQGRAKCHIWEIVSQTTNLNPSF